MRRSSASPPRRRLLVLVAGGVIAVLAAWAVRPAWQSAQPALPPIEPVRLTVPATADPALAEAVRQGEAVAAELLRHYPDDPAALYLAGDLCRQFGAVDQALALWRRCVALEPRCQEAQLGMGAVYFEQGQFDQAADALARALELRPDAAEAALLLAQTHMNQGRPREVIELLAPRAAAEPASMPCQLLLGQAYLQLKDYARAKPHFAAAVRLAPEHPSAYLGLATCSGRLGQTAEAARWTREFQQRGAAGLSGRLEGAQRPDDTAAVRATVARACATAASLYAQRGRQAEADAHFRAAARLH